MKIQQPLLEFALRFVLTFIVAAVVSFLYSYFAHGTAQADWDFCVRIAIIFAVVLTISPELEEKNRENVSKTSLRL